MAVIRAGAQWEPLAVNAMDEGSKSTPAIVDEKLYIRTYDGRALARPWRFSRRTRDSWPGRSPRA